MRRSPRESARKFRAFGLFLRALVPVCASCVALFPSTGLADGYHTPFRSAKEVRKWWTTEQAGFPTSITPTKSPQGQSSTRPGTVATVPGQIRRAMGELLQTLRFFHAENVIRTEFPEITGNTMTSVHTEIQRILINLGEIGLPYLLQEIALEIDQGHRPRWTKQKADKLAMRTAREYFEASLDQIQVLEEKLEKEVDPAKSNDLIFQITRIKAGVDFRGLTQLQAQLSSQYQALKPRRKYLNSLLHIVRKLDVRACEGLITSLPTMTGATQRRFQSLLISAVRKGMSGQSEPGWRTNHLTLLLPEFLEHLSSENDLVKATAAECLLLITGRRFGTDLEKWHHFLREVFAPELAPALDRKKPPRRPSGPEKAPPREMRPNAKS